MLFIINIDSLDSHFRPFHQFPRHLWRRLLKLGTLVQINISELQSPYALLRRIKIIENQANPREICF